MRILHLTADHPDPLAPGKTRAVANLLELVPEHEHIVYSLNRVHWRHGVSALAFGAGHRAIAYGAPPRGLLMAARLDRVAAFILEDLARRGLSPDLVHAHKISVEGLVCERVAAGLGRPFLLSSQGNSDLKILRARPDLRRRWRRVWRAARVVLPFAPWTARGLEALLGPRAGPVACLPCPTPQDALHAPRIVGPRVVTAFHLAGHANKNARAVIAAVGRLAAEIPEIALEIVGGDDAEAFATLADAVHPVPAAQLAGPVPHHAMPALFNGAAACVIPSRRESYGMALAEALMAGCPVLYTRGTALDGYLEEGRASLSVPPGDPQALGAGIARLLREEAGFKARLAEMQEAGELELFRRRGIAEVYRGALKLAGAVPEARVAL